MVYGAAGVEPPPVAAGHITPPASADEYHPSRRITGSAAAGWCVQGSEAPGTRVQGVVFSIKFCGRHDHRGHMTPPRSPWRCACRHGDRSCDPWLSLHLVPHLWLDPLVHVTTDVSPERKKKFKSHENARLYPMELLPYRAQYISLTDFLGREKLPVWLLNLNKVFKQIIHYLHWTM